MITKNLWDKLEAYGFGANVDALEAHISRLQDSAGMGNPEVTDTQYDDLIMLLKGLKPDSYVITRNWEVIETDLTEDDVYLDRYGMKSIKTIQSMDELNSFRDSLPEEGGIALTASIKMNGHAFRAVYRRGMLSSGTTRGRYKRGRDITKHLREILPNFVEEWAEAEVVEVRGELLVSLSTFESLRNILKTPLSSVTSLSRDSASVEEMRLLEGCCYQVFSDDLEFNSLKGKFETLKRCGFKVPFVAFIGGINKYNFSQYIDNVLDFFGKAKDNGQLIYDSDGVVVAIDDMELFNNLGSEGNTQRGNFALKMGQHWESNVYSSTIISIEWCYGKSYITPKAIVEPIITRNGAEITTVPLYNIAVMQRYEYYPGNEIYCKFGGEQGVTTCDSMGNSVSGNY